MKIIKYDLCSVLEDGSEALFPVILPWNEENEKLAASEAHDGYTVDEDGEPEPEQTTPLESRVEALEAALETNIQSLDVAYEKGVNSL